MTRVEFGDRIMEPQSYGIWWRSVSADTMLRTGFQLPRNGIPVSHVNNNNNCMKQPIFIGFIQALLGL